MKTIKNIIRLLLITFVIVSCSHTDKKADTNSDEYHHSEHSDEGVVFLNGRQKTALNLKTGGFVKRNLTSVVKVNGQLEVPPESSAEVTAVMGGNVKSIKVFQGDKVQKGEVLAELEHPDYITLQEEFAEQAGRLQFLQEEYDRQKKLYENNVGAGREFQKVKADLNSAKSKYAGLKARLELLNISPSTVGNGDIVKAIRILSPIEGYINSVNIKVGSYVDAKDIIFTITDNSRIHADFLVYEKDISMVRDGQVIHFTATSLPGIEFEAKVFAVGKEFDDKVRAVHVHAEIENGNGKLIPGMYITGHLHTDKKYAIALPDDAIVKDGIKSYIFIEVTSATTEHLLERDEHIGHSNEIYDTVTAYKQVEVITGRSDAGYTEVFPVDTLSDNVKVVLNVAYYLLADMKKEETEHEH